MLCTTRHKEYNLYGVDTSKGWRKIGCQISFTVDTTRKEENGKTMNRMEERISNPTAEIGLEEGQSSDREWENRRRQ